ncbi:MULTISPECIES: hypothetical protein [unclassified Knoellia]|uniref:hypothetical protein n=1 Tax=Knoellia altitudinis TaxID=3404795 RepID=UPI003618A3E6
MKIFPFGVQMSWGFGLVLAALVLGNKSTNALAWAMATLGVVVALGAFCSQIVDDLREQLDAAERMARTPHDDV